MRRPIMGHDAPPERVTRAAPSGSFRTIQAWEKTPPRQSGTSRDDSPNEERRKVMRSWKRGIGVVGGALFVMTLAGAANAQSRDCTAFPRNRAGNIQEGICFARSGAVGGTRAQISQQCERLIACNPWDR